MTKTELGRKALDGLPCDITVRLTEIPFLNMPRVNRGLVKPELAANASAAALMGQHDQDKQHAKCRRGHGEEI